MYFAGCDETRLLSENPQRWRRRKVWTKKINTDFIFVVSIILYGIVDTFFIGRQKTKVPLAFIIICGKLMFVDEDGCRLQQWETLFLPF